jgi:putative ABC transport system permease protein
MRIVRLLIVESLVLAIAGAGLGIFLAWGGLNALVAALPARVIPSEAVIELNAPVLAATLAIAVLTALMCGLAPAWQSFRRDLSDPLRDSSKGVGGGFRGGRLRDLVVVMEVALSLTLLIGAGLLMRSFVALREVRLGVKADHIFTAVLQLPADRYATAEQVRAFMQPLLVRIRALPGVVHAAASTAGALDSGSESRMEIAGKPLDAASQTLFQQATEDHFRTLRFEFREGRPLNEADVNGARKVAVANEAFVRKYLANDRPLGHRVRLVNLETAPEPVHDAWFEIVGVVGDVRNRGLRAPIEPEVWIPSTITGSPLQILNVRTSQDPLMLTNAVKREVSATDADVPLAISGRLEDFADQGMYAGPRFGFLLMMVFGCVGLVLVTVGVYSVLAYSTTRKTHEIGIRMALGAQGADVLGMVVKSGVRLVALGIAVGIATSLILGRMIEDQLVNVTAYDPPTLAATTFLLILIAAIGCWIPARRAARVDPMVALRYE